DFLVGRVVAKTKGLGFDSRIEQSMGLGFIWFFENFSVVARSLELCPVYGNSLTLLNRTYNSNGEKWVYIVALRAVIAPLPTPSGIKRRDVIVARSTGLPEKMRYLFIEQDGDSIPLQKFCEPMFLSTYSFVYSNQLPSE
ncbi:hypothetical protein SFRURICE_009190, partial [Spodoptera frugiperda]